VTTIRLSRVWKIATCDDVPFTPTWNVPLLMLIVPRLRGVESIGQNILPIAMQLPLNGMVAVIAADIIATNASVRRLVACDRPTERRRLRAFAFHAFVLVATLPLLLLVAVDSRVTAAKQEADGSARLHEVVTALSGHIGDYVSNHAQAVQSLAATVGHHTRDAAERQQLLTDYHDVYPGFITLLVADHAGIVNQIFPPRTTSPPVSDREYFIEAVRTKRIAISDVILGRLSHVPIVTIAMPMLDAAGDARGFDVARMMSYEVHGARVSSSAVRAALASGDMELATALLGRPYSISGHVLHGKKLGRDLGFPTMNLRFAHPRPAAMGIFVVRVHGLTATPLAGVANLGVRPTVDDAGRVLLEVYCLDWPAQLGNDAAYGHVVRVDLLAKLHDELRYPSMQALRDGIAGDVAQARQWFAAHLT
jgi:hypothetical protein